MNKLEYWRSKRKLTIRELAQISSVNASTISRIENGRKAFSSTLGKLAEALEVDLVELAELSEDTEEPSQSVEPDTDTPTFDKLSKVDSDS